MKWYLNVGGRKRVGEGEGRGGFHAGMEDISTVVDREHQPLSGFKCNVFVDKCKLCVDFETQKRCKGVRMQNGDHRTDAFLKSRSKVPFVGM